jgi:PAS domain-containing protein
MSIAVKSCRSLRTLLIIMIAAPVLPAIGLGPLVLARLAASWHELGVTAEVALAGVGLRVLGGMVALAAAGRLIASTRSLGRAAKALADGLAPPQSSSGVVEIDDVIRVMTGASASLRCRSEAFERAEAARRDSEARLRDFAETGSDWYWETDRDHRFTYQSEHIRDFGQDPSSRLGRARLELAADGASEPQKWRDHVAALERHEAFASSSIGGRSGRSRSISCRSAASRFSMRQDNSPATAELRATSASRCG